MADAPASATRASALGRIRFVFDENLLKAGRALCQLRATPDMACFGHPPIAELVGTGALDTDWIPTVDERGWVVITHDRRLRTRPLEASLAIRHGLKVVHLHRAGAMTAWDQAARLLKSWEAIEKQVTDAPSGPWWLDVRGARLDSKSFQPGVAERA